jgi:hypothetical protein
MSAVALARLMHEALAGDQQILEQGILQGVQSWDEYLAATGKRRGLMQAQAILDDVVRRFDEQN